MKIRVLSCCVGGFSIGGASGGGDRGLRVITLTGEIEMLKVELDTKGRRVVSLGGRGSLRAGSEGAMIYGELGVALGFLPYPKNNNGEVISPSDDELLELAGKWGSVGFADLMYERIFAWLSENAKSFTFNERVGLIDLGGGKPSLEGWFLEYMRGVGIVCRTKYDLGELLSFKRSFRTHKECSEYFEEIQRYGVESACEILAYKLTEKLRGGWVGGF